MSEGLRAEDVEEALARASKGTVWYTDEEPWPTIVAAARAWSNPDYGAATRALIDLARKADLYPTHSDNWAKRARTIVDAALVGFHPQDEGDER